MEYEKRAENKERINAKIINMFGSLIELKSIIYYQNIMNYENMQFLAYTPRFSQFKMLVSDEMINKENANLQVSDK